VQRGAACPFRIHRRSFNVSPGPVRQRVARKGAVPAPAITQRKGNTSSLDGNSTELGIPRPELLLELCPLRELPPSPVEEIPIQFNVSRRAGARSHVDTNTASRPLISPYISGISRLSIRASSLPRCLSFLLPSVAGLFPERSFQTRLFCAVFGCFLVRERRTAVKSVCEAEEELFPQNSSPQPPLYPQPLARGLNGTRFLDACARSSPLANTPQRRRVMLVFQDVHEDVQGVAHSISDPSKVRREIHRDCSCTRGDISRAPF